MIDPHSYSASIAASSDQRTAGYMPVIGQKKGAEAENFSGLVQKAQDSAPPGDAAKPAGNKEHHGFLDFLVMLFDIINPLEHIPVVSTIYERVTGHHINPIARVAGDTLYGGPIGAAVGVANVVAEQTTGKDIGENVLAMLSQPKHNTAPDTMLAQNAPRPHIIWNDRSPAPVAVASADAPANATARASLLTPNVKQNFPSFAAQQSHGAKTAGKQLADYVLSRTPPVQYAKDGTSAAENRPEGAIFSKPSDSTPGLSVQDAPADAPERAIPPGLIAQKMMAGLDKYAALKREQQAPGYSATF
ncbi:MAG: hypothetical protein EPN97_01830 [Alphaproteobacteria bacterium]|nr:MAG: hypothetical protein EPN97_01830 [Alphaproteobacteria bacterium]